MFVLISTCGKGSGTKFLGYSISGKLIDHHLTVRVRLGHQPVKEVFQKDVYVLLMEVFLI